MAKEVFANLWAASRSATSTAPASGTSESWTGMTATLGSLPVLAAGEQLRVVEDDDTRQSEIILVTAADGAGNWTVTRGAEGTTPVVHPSGVNFVQSLTKAVLDGFQTKTIRVAHTFTVAGPVAVASGDTNYIPPFFVPVPAGQRVTLADMRRRITSGTYVDYKIQKNGTDLLNTTGVGGAQPTTTNWSSVSSTGIGTTFADGDMLALVVAGVGGSPYNLSVTVYLDYTIGI